MVSPNTQSGFTLIEMLISLSLFSVVITITVGSLLVLIDGNRELGVNQSVMDSLAFSLDSMTREIRTGRAYYCASATSASGIFSNSGSSHENLDTTTQDCPNGNQQNRRFHGISVIEGGESVTGESFDRILYYYDAGVGGAPGTIMRRVGNNSSQSIFSSGVNVTEADFYVTGSTSLAAGGDTQPTVTIRLTATDIHDSENSITLQTTITQRELDI